MSDNPLANSEDVRHDDLEFDPAVQPPKKSKAWLNRLIEAEEAFESWNDHCDRIDKLYASLDRLATNAVASGRMVRDREFAMFWANCEVIKPSIYASAPVPVVVPVPVPLDAPAAPVPPPRHWPYETTGTKARLANPRINTNVFTASSSSPCCERAR